MTQDRKAADNKGFAIAGAPCFADTFVVNQSLVLRINICGENRHFAKPENVVGNFTEPTQQQQINN